MLRLILTLLLSGWLWTLGTVSSAAQPICGDHGEIRERLEKAYAERPQAIGLSQDGGLVEVLVSPSGGWTILITYPDRPTCVVATGKGWESQVILLGQAT